MKLFRKNSRFLLLLASFWMASVVVSSAAFAAAPSCRALFSATPQFFSLLQQNWKTGIGERGFLGSVPELTESTGGMARAKGLFWWSLAFYVKPTIADAIAHSQAEPNALLQGLYLIGNVDSSSDLSVKPNPAELYKSLSKNGVYEVKDGQAIRLNDTQVAALIRPDILKWKLTKEERGPFMEVQGWTFPKRRGIILFEDTFKSDSIRKVHKHARKLMKEGYTFSFNKNFEECIDFLANQKRKGKSGVGGRYADEAVRAEAIASWREGTAFSTEVRDPKGELVAGSIGLHDGNIVGGDTVFYDDINLAKIAVLMTMERAYQAGIPFVDAQMVSNFTASMKGKEIPAEEFMSRVDALPAKRVTLDFSDWIPKGAGIDYSAPTMIIVDGYSSGRFLAPEMQKKGMQVIHIHTRGKPFKPGYARTFNPKDYDLDIPYTGDMAVLLNQLKQFKQIEGVLSGADSGVLFADQLSTSLKKWHRNLPSNGEDLARKDKFLQGERLREQGIDSALQIKTSNLEEGVSWVKQNRLLEGSHPAVVVKPVDSAGADGVYIVRNEAELRRAIQQSIGAKNQMGLTNASVLIQEFLQGTEYVINTTSRDGHHVVSGIWVYQKRAGAGGQGVIYDLDMLLPFQGQVQQTVVNYTLQVLKALGIQNGNGHAEVMMVPGRGPVLVEMNNRVMGAGLTVLETAAIGRSQIELTTFAFTNPAEFKKLPINYDLQSQVVVVTLANFEKGKILSPEADRLVKSLKGYYSHSFDYRDKEQPLTIDLASAPGTVLLMSKNKDEIKASVEALHRMERDGSLFINGN